MKIKSQATDSRDSIIIKVVFRLFVLSVIPIPPPFRFLFIRVESSKRGQPKRYSEGRSLYLPLLSLFWVDAEDDESRGDSWIMEFEARCGVVIVFKVLKFSALPDRNCGLLDIGHLVPGYPTVAL